MLLDTCARKITKKDIILKEEFLTNCKKYKFTLHLYVNMLNLINILKQIGNRIKNTLKGMKSLISLKIVFFNFFKSKAV